MNLTIEVRSEMSTSSAGIFINYPCVLYTCMCFWANELSPPQRVPFACSISIPCLSFGFGYTLFFQIAMHDSAYGFSVVSDFFLAIMFTA